MNQGENPSVILLSLKVWPHGYINISWILDHMWHSPVRTVSQQSHSIWGRAIQSNLDMCLNWIFLVQWQGYYFWVPSWTNSMMGGRVTLRGITPSKATPSSLCVSVCIHAHVHVSTYWRKLSNQVPIFASPAKSCQVHQKAWGFCSVEKLFLRATATRIHPPGCGLWESGNCSFKKR